MNRHKIKVVMLDDEMKSNRQLQKALMISPSISFEGYAQNVFIFRELISWARPDCVIIDSDCRAHLEIIDSLKWLSEYYPEVQPIILTTKGEFFPSIGHIDPIYFRNYNYYRLCEAVDKMFSLAQLANCPPA